jgi:hypothetical protein
VCAAGRKVQSESDSSDFNSNSFFELRCCSSRQGYPQPDPGGQVHGARRGDVIPMCLSSSSTRLDSAWLGYARLPSHSHTSSHRVVASHSIAPPHHTASHRMHALAVCACVSRIALRTRRAPRTTHHSLTRLAADRALSLAAIEAIDDTSAGHTSSLSSQLRQLAWGRVVAGVGACGRERSCAILLERARSCSVQIESDRFFL